jgi:putative iron-only hydrogenase system regulator
MDFQNILPDCKDFSKQKGKGNSFRNLRLPDTCWEAFVFGGIMEKRIGVVAIVIENIESADKVNSVLHNYSHIIVGRMGIPYRERGISVISLIVDGTSDEISALTGKLGKIEHVNVKSALTKN